MDSSRDGSALVNVPASCNELDVVTAAALPLELSPSMAVAVPLIEAAVADSRSLGIRVPGTGLSVVPPITGSSDEDPAKVVIVEITEPSILAAVLLTDPVFDPDMSSTELDVEISLGNRVLVEMASVSVRAAVKLNVPTVSEKFCVLEPSGNPSIVNWPSEALSIGAEAPMSVGLGDGAG